MKLGIDPKIDYAFKRVFGHEKNGHILISLLEPGGAIPFCEDLEMHLLQLPLFQARKIQQPLDQWLYFLQNAPQLDSKRPPPFLTDHAVVDAFQELIMLSKTAKQRQHYEDRVKGERDRISALFAAREKGLALGIEQGREQGIEQGIEKGILIGEAMLYQQLLKRAEFTAEELATKSMKELRRIHTRFKRESER